MEFIFDHQFLGSFLEMFGKITLAVAVLLFHKKLVKEQKVDKKVIKEMKNEQYLTIFAIILIISGFLIKHLSEYCPAFI